MGVGVILRVVTTRNCSDIARRPGSDFGDIPDVQRRSGSFSARLGTNDVEERPRSHRSEMLLVIVCLLFDGSLML